MTTDTKQLSDKEYLEQFLSFLEDRIDIDTNFIVDEASGNITHQFIKLSCGDYSTVSAPQQLDLPLRPVLPNELHVTIN